MHHNHLVSNPLRSNSITKPRFPQNPSSQLPKSPQFLPPQKKTEPESKADLNTKQHIQHRKN